MGKIRETRELYKEVVNQLSQSEENWLKFLDSSSWNFKYDFDDQILIYAQRPDAKACATMEEWNKKLKRWVNGGTKPIYIFDKNPYSEYPFKLVFDLSDTHNYNNTEYKLWTIKEEYEPEIIESLEASFGDIDSKETLAQAIIGASYNMVIDNMEDYLTSIMEHKANSMLADLTDDEIKSLFMTTVWASVSYMMMTRCKINAREEIQPQEFSYIKYFNNQELITTFGASVSDIAEMGLREIARTVANLQKSEKLKNRTIEKFDKEMYSKDNEKIKGGNEDGRENRLHETRGLLHAQPNNGEREDTSREVFSNEIQLSKESQKPRVDDSSDEQGIEETSNRSTGTSKQEGTTVSGRNGKERWSNGRIESEKSNGMGGLHEQLQDDSTRDSSKRTNLHLGAYNRDSSKPSLYVVTDAKVNQILTNAPHLRVSNSEIKQFFENEKDKNKRAEFLKSSFNIDYTEIMINDERYGYKAFENGLLLWKGSFLSRDTESFISWEELIDNYEAMIMLNQLQDVQTRLPSVTDQMSLINPMETKPELEFTQEFIDRVLQERGTFSKYSIYQQFESHLSLKDNADYLKRMYGLGYYGTSGTVAGSGIGLQCSPKGMTLNRGYFKDEITITISWNDVAKRITELIRLERYLNEKELAEYPNWLKEQEQAKEVQEAGEKLEKQADQQEYELAKRVYLFVKPSELYNYTDDIAAFNTDEENIEIVKADINDTKNVNDYVKALNAIRENIEETDSQKHELDVLISILEKRVPHYEYHLGDTVYIGADKYEIVGIKDNIVTLLDAKFPILNKQMDFDEFERKVKDNYSNDHLIVKEKTEKDITNDDSVDETNVNQKNDTISIIDNNKANDIEEHALKLFFDDLAEDIDSKELLDSDFALDKKIDILKSIHTTGAFQIDDVEYRITEEGIQFKYNDSKYGLNWRNIAELFIDYLKEENKEEKPYKVGQEVYLESDRKYKIDTIDLEHDKISLLDLSMNYPIFREESILTFENLYNQNERNFPEQNIKPNFVKNKSKIQDFILHPEVALEDRNNYKITDNDLGVGTPREKFDRNIAAIKVLKKCEKENRYATPEEQEIMSKYVGWGGLQQAFKEDDSSWANENKILKELLNEEEYKNARSSVLTAFYTPPIVIKSMYEILQNMGLKEANILEPSCGVGNFFGMLPTELEKCKMYGVELDSISGRIAGQLYQKSTIAVNAYEKVDLPDSFFDVAVRQCAF